MKKLKVLMVAGDMHVGGIENQLMHLARNADRSQFQIDFTSTRPDAFYREEIESLGGRFLLIPHMSLRRPWVYCAALRKVMEEGGYDVVHSHELFHSGITLWVAKLAGVPSRFVHAHNWRDDDGTGRSRGIVRSVYHGLMRFAINRCSTAQIACSSWAGDFLYGKKMTKKDSYHLVYNSVDTGKFLERYDRRESGAFCDDGWKNVLNVARITAVKNQLFLVEIAGELRRRGKRIRILCAGNGDKAYEAAVRQAIAEQGLEEYIRLLGVCRDIDVLARKCSAFVLPSRFEGMPLVMIEAQAAGLHCVSADTYSPEVDFGINTVTWLPLEAGAAAWADALESAVEAEKPEKSAVERVIQEKKFDSRMFAQTMCRLYREDVEKQTS